MTNGREKTKKKWQKSLMEQVELLLKNSLSASEDIKIKSPFKYNGKKVSLTLYFVPGESSYKFFTRNAWHKTSVEEINKEASFNNTLIGFIEF